VTNVSVGFRPPCWCSSGWAPTWRLHTRLFILQLSIISQILELIYWTITIFSFDHMTNENRELTKLVRSRWLDIGLVLFLRVYGPDSVSVHKLAKEGTCNWPISNHLDRTSLVNNPYILTRWGTVPVWFWIIGSCLYIDIISYTPSF